MTATWKEFTFPLISSPAAIVICVTGSVLTWKRGWRKTARHQEIGNQMMINLILMSFSNVLKLLLISVVSWLAIDHYHRRRTYRWLIDRLLIQKNSMPMICAYPRHVNLTAAKGMICILWQLESSRVWKRKIVSFHSWKKSNRKKFLKKVQYRWTRS